MPKEFFCPFGKEITMRNLLISLALMLALCSIAAARQSTTKLEGQIVCCEDCWNRADRKTVTYGTTEDLEKAAQCVANGDPTLLAVTSPEGATVFYQLEVGNYQREGKNWLSYIGKRVAVTGTTGKKRRANFIKIDTLTVLAPAIAESQPQTSTIGTSVDLALQDLFGVEQRLSSYRGRIVVLNFWATWCVPCRKEMPDLAALQNDYAALGVQVISAAAETLAEKAKVMQFIKETRLNFPVWLGATAGDMARFGLGSALPATVILGRDGNIAALYRGVIKLADLRKQIDGMLAAAEASSKVQIAAAKKTKKEVSVVPS
jgi:thiol-disulfide isomerase/thioredoxin